jgi:hypothetical protein
MCCTVVSAVWAETDTSGDEAQTPPQQDEANGDDDPPPGDTDGDPDEDRLTIPEITFDLLMFLKRLGISM